MKNNDELEIIAYDIGDEYFRSLSEGNNITISNFFFSLPVDKFKDLTMGDVVLIFTKLLKNIEYSKVVIDDLDLINIDNEIDICYLSTLFTERM